MRWGGGVNPDSLKRSVTFSLALACASLSPLVNAETTSTDTPTPYVVAHDPIRSDSKTGDRYLSDWFDALRIDLPAADGTAVGVSGTDNSTLTIVNLDGLTISSTFESASEVGGIKGIESQMGGTVQITTQSDILTDLEGNSNVVGLSVGENTGDSSSMFLVSESGSIVTEINRNGDTSNDAHGARISNGSTLNLNAGKNIVFDVNSTTVNDYQNAVTGVSVVKGSFKAEAGGYVSISANGPFADADALSIAALDGFPSEADILAEGKDDDGFGIRITAQGGDSLSLTSNDRISAVSSSGNLKLETTSGAILLKADSLVEGCALCNTSGRFDITSASDVILSASSQSDQSYGIYSTMSTSDSSIAGDKIKISSRSEATYAYGVTTQFSAGTTSVFGNTLKIKASSVENSLGYGIYAPGGNISTTTTDSTEIEASGTGILVEDNSGFAGKADIRSYKTISVQSDSTNIYARNGGEISLWANQDITLNTKETSVFSINANSRVQISSCGGKNSVTGETGVYATDEGTISLRATQGNEVTATGTYGLYAQKASSISVLSTEHDNTVATGTVDDEGYGTGMAVVSFARSSVTVQADGQNLIKGAVWLIGAERANESTTSVTLTAFNNEIYSHGVIDNAGDLNTDSEFAGTKVFSALYAEGHDAELTVTGNRNVIYTKADPEKNDELERTIWAYDGADITVNGNTSIRTNQYEKSPNSLDVAIAAGTAVGLTEDIVNTQVAEDAISNVTINYGTTDGVQSDVNGDILAAYAGRIAIRHGETDTVSGIWITGNLLAGNGGTLDVDLGTGGMLTGRVDDYGDAGQVDQSGHGDNTEGSFFNPAFSSTIYKGGTVNLTMGEGSRWEVTGQSWVSSIKGTASDLSQTTPVIDLIAANTDRNQNAHALTIGKLSGNAVFNLNLDADRDVSDMLYLKKADGIYTIHVVDAVTREDMYAEDYDGLRFATVGKGSNVAFRAVTYDQGALNVEYEVGTDAYEGNQHNDDYNGSSLTANKPGSDIVDNFFGADETTTQADRTVANSTEGEGETGGDTPVMPDKVAVDETTNFKLIGRKGEDPSDAGKTIINMSRGNYAQAVYMDTLNKRQGEMRFAKGREDGLWARVRYDRLGMDSAYEIDNTMLEIGADSLYRTDSGEFHTGVAFDYMKGDTDYEGVIGGDGNIDRYGAWVYSTWLGDEGDYWDVVGKFGHLENDFEIYARSTGERIKGDYDNNVFSFSVEYGKKFDNDKKWYIEPQVQAQYAYVTSADYVTSQETKVDLDAIHSLIGRVGVRVGKDLETESPSTLYVRGDILHEFLGDQDIRAEDKTGVLYESYENEGTWYSVGAGFSYMTSEDLYVFFEGEKVFGNSNSGSFTLSGGLRYLF